MYLSRSKSVLQFIARLTSIVLFFLFLLAYIFSYDLGSALPLMVIIVSVTEIIMLLYNPNVRNTGLSMIFFLYTLIVHNGFVVAYYFDESYINWRSATSMAYVTNDYYPTAILISNIVILVFVWSTEINKNIILYDKKEDSFKDIKSNDYIEKGNKVADFIGIIAVGTGTLILAYYVLTKGLFMAKYIDVLSVTKDISVIQQVVVLTSLAIALLISSGTKRGGYIGLAIYMVYMFLHFSIGNRGEALYAGVILFALFSLRYKTIKVRHVIIIGLAVVILIPLVRVMREGKIDAYTLNPISAFLEVLTEQGFQISPFTYIVEYLEQGHDYVWGMTYINYFTDFILRRVGAQSPWMETEQYVIKSIMPYNGMGFSMIAELFYNFTIVGACIVYSIFARFMVWIDKKIYYDEISPTKKMFLVMLMVELINLTRNDSSTLPIYLAYAIIFTTVYSISNLLVRRR